MPFPAGRSVDVFLALGLTSEHHRDVIDEWLHILDLPLQVGEITDLTGHAAVADLEQDSADQFSLRLAEDLIEEVVESILQLPRFFIPRSTRPFFMGIHRVSSFFIDSV